MQEPSQPVLAPRIWQVGALCRAVADALEARFNPVAVCGEVSGFSRASSGHCYFSLKDAQGQIRCAMFRRTASMLDFTPGEGDKVEVFGRLGVYEQRGDLQLIVESLRRAGQGALYEQFMRLKLKLQEQGLFDAARKRTAPPMPSGIGLVTSTGAAALHDVVTALRRRAPHIPVFLAPAAVQGAQAPAELVRALQSLYRLAEKGSVQVILLVRGGGSLEDLWAFNDEQLALTIVQSPVPIICGVGHETDFTIADFCADLRAPTPTAAAELAAQSRQEWLAQLQAAQERLASSATHRLDTAGQRLDRAAARLGRPLARMASQQLRLVRITHRLRQAVQTRWEKSVNGCNTIQDKLGHVVRARLDHCVRNIDRFELRLQLLDPRLVLQRGYALLSDTAGHAVTSVAQTHPGQPLRASLADGELDVTVTETKTAPN